MKKNIFIFLGIALLMLAAPNVARAEALETPGKQVIIVDFDTGNILFEKNADEKMPTSSMSKVMTVYMVFDALKKGNIKLEDEFLVSEKAWRTQGSKMFVPIHGNIKVDDLLRGVIIQSGNDATIVLAEGLAGTEEAFAEAMNKKMQEMGMTNSHFVNASGWPDPEHYSTARDLSILARRMVADFPDYYSLFSEKEFTYNGIKQGNRNPLLYRNIGADGIKTGHTEDAGYGLMATGIKDGRRVVLVVNGLTSMQERADETARLLQWGLNGFKNVKLFTDNPALTTIPVVMGVEESVPVRAGREVVVTLPKLAENKMSVDVTYKTPLVAPITEGQEVGTVTVHIPDAPQITAPLVAAKPVAELSYIMKLLAKAKMLSSSDSSSEEVAAANE